jgi:hypothetical protein
VSCFAVCSAVLHAVVAGLLANSQYPDGPALTGHLGTGFSWFPCLKANAEMVPKTPSCYCKLFMWPSRLNKLLISHLCICIMTSATGRQHTGSLMHIIIKFINYSTSGPGSSVGIAKGYGLVGPGIESRWRRDFPHLSRPALGLLV